jgi:dTDP-4-dehydrorhamnose 3,5-epimerase
MNRAVGEFTNTLCYNMNMSKIYKPFIDGLLLLQPKVFADDRGYFFESYNMEVVQQLGITDHFRQDNESKSSKAVLRGLHFQKPPYAQGKLVRVVKGSVLDVVVDIRENSPTYGKYFSVELTGENKQMLWIPAGFAHGFLTLEDDTIFSYKCTQIYNKESEGCLIWNDPDLAIEWGVGSPLVSDKDKLGIEFKNFQTPFK